MSRPLMVIAAAGVLCLLAACGSSDTSSSGGSGAAVSSGQSPAPKESSPSGDIPDTQAYVPYTVPSGTVSVKVPEGWARTETASSVTFSSHFNSVRLETVPAAGAPTIGSAQAAEVPAIQQHAGNVAMVNVTSATRAAGPVIRITYQADSPPDSVTGKRVRLDVERYEFWHAGTEAIVTLSAPTGSDNVDPWHTITDSFKWA